jgi:hypothetical protein
LCRSESTISIFSQDWWLDAVCGKENWDVALAEKGGEVVGSLPYHIVSQYGFKVIAMPSLTQTMGPWLRYPKAQKASNRLSLEMEILSELITKLPPHGYFHQSFHYTQTNWLPFYWNGYDQTTRYTYVLPDLTDLDEVYGAFENSLRRNLSKAENTIEVQDSDDIDQFFEINSLTYAKQGLPIPYSRELVRALDAACKGHGRRKILMARNEQGELCAGLYVVWDANAMYNLMSGIDPRLKVEGAAKLLTWEAIKFAQGVTKTYDFEGSMLRNIERVNRSYGAAQLPYSSITKIGSVPLRAFDAVRQLATCWKKS